MSYLATPSNKRGFTLIEATLCIMVVGLVMSGVFILMKNVQRDILIEKVKNDIVFLISESRSYTNDIRPSNDLSILMDGQDPLIPLPSGMNKIGASADPQRSLCYATDYAACWKVRYIKNSHTILVTAGFYDDYHISARLEDFFSSNMKSLGIKTVILNDGRLEITAYVEIGD